MPDVPERPEGNGMNTRLAEMYNKEANTQLQGGAGEEYLYTVPQ